MNCKSFIGGFTLYTMEDGLYLPLPEDDNSDQLGNLKINRRTLGNELKTLGTSFSSVHSYRFNNLSDEQYIDLIYWHTKYLGKEINFANHYGELFLGILLNPELLFTEEQDCAYSVELRIQCLARLPPSP